MLVEINAFLLLGLLKVNITRSGKHSVNPLDMEKNSRLISWRNYYPHNILFKLIALETHRQRPNTVTASSTALHGFAALLEKVI